MSLDTWMTSPFFTLSDPPTKIIIQAARSTNSLRMLVLIFRLGTRLGFVIAGELGTSHGDHKGVMLAFMGVSLIFVYPSRRDPLPGDSRSTFRVIPPRGQRVFESPAFRAGLNIHEPGPLRSTVVLVYTNEFNEARGKKVWVGRRETSLGRSLKESGRGGEGKNLPAEYFFLHVRFLFAYNTLKTKPCGASPVTEGVMS